MRLLALECGVAEEDRSGVINPGAALAGHQTKRNVGRPANPTRAERASVTHKRNQAFRLFALICPRAFRTDAARAAILRLGKLGSRRWWRERQRDQCVSAERRGGG